MLEFTAVAIVPPVEAPVQKAERLIALRNKAERTLNRVKAAQQAVEGIEPREILAESEQLVKELQDINEIWQRIADLGTEIASCSEQDAVNVIKLSQETLDVKILSENEKLSLNIRDYGLACCKLREQSINKNTRRVVSMTPPPLTALASGARRLYNKLQLTRISLPEFSGKMHEYPSFCDNWEAIVEPDLNETGQLRSIRLQVPIRD